MRIAYLVFVLAGFTNLLWVFAGMAIVMAKSVTREPSAAVRAVYHELRPFYLPLVLVGNVAWVISRGSSGMAVYGQVALDVLLWFLYRNVVDDDRWKRRGKRLTERVARVGDRLDVVPGGAS